MPRLLYLRPLLALISCKKDVPVFVEQGTFIYYDCSEDLKIMTNNLTPLFPYNLHRFDVEPVEGLKVLVTYTYLPYAFQECVGLPVEIMEIEVMD